MNRRYVPVTAGVATMLLAIVACSSGDGSTDASDAAGGSTLKLAMNSPQDNPIYSAAVALADDVANGTDGKWEIEIFPNETLGTQPQTLDLVSDGSVDLAIVAGAILSNWNPDFVAFDLPTMFDDVEQQVEIINDDEITHELYTSLEDRNITVLGGFTQGARSLYTVGGEVRTPEDMSGLKIRVQDSEMFIEMIDAMGGSATPMDFGEVYTGLQSGVIDGSENNEVSYAANKHYEVAPHYSYTNHVIAVDYIVASTSTLERLSDDERGVLDEATSAAVLTHLGLWGDETAAAIAEAEAGGAVFYDNVDHDRFADALDDVLSGYLERSDVVADLHARIQEIRQ